MDLRLLVPALALLATSALSQGASDGIVRGLCQPDGCDEFTILSAERVTATDEGALLRTRLKTFHASYGGRRETGQENGYVYCSRTRPAIMAEQNGRTLAFFLAPFATEDSRESVRRNANFHALYFTLCHGAEAGKAAVRDLPGVAREHGYRVPLAQSRLATLNRAEDVLGPGARPPVEERRVEARPPVETVRPQAPEKAPESPPPRQPSSRSAEEEKGLLSGPRRLTNQAFDTLDEVGSWVLGRGR